jgi:hypothetical protein
MNGSDPALAPPAAAGKTHAPFGFAIAWLAALAFLSGGAATFLAMVLFLAGVALPCWLVLTAALRRPLADDGLARLLAAVATLVAVAPLYILRKAVPLPPAIADALIAAAAWSLAWRTHALQGFGSSSRAALRGPGRWYVAVVLPAVFCLSWLGYAVRRADSVDYFGLFFVDFGNLVSIENVIRASTVLPTSPVAQSGALGYHWLYFAFPAWSADFFGLGGQSANALVMANLMTASLLYAALARVCTRALDATSLPVDRARVASHLAGLALFALSTLYAYQAVASVLHRPWLTLGTRNNLLLQLPHSMTCFGNNTLALVFCLLTLELLTRWSAAGRRAELAFAALLTALLPGYGMTLVFPMCLAVAAWSISGRNRRPLLTLPTFGAFAAVLLAIFRVLGLLSYGSGGGIAVSFDHGQFIQNVVLGFFPVTFAIGICLWRAREPGVLASFAPHVWALVGCVVTPTFLMTRGSPTSNVDLSMKVASLYLVAAVPFFAIAAAWLMTGWRRTRGLALVGAALTLAGLVNAGAYTFQHALRRVRNHGGVTQSIPLDHHLALELVARQPARLILIDELSIPSTIADPAVMVGGKRTLVASGYEEVVFAPSAAARENKAAWLEWQRGGHGDEALAVRLADGADLLIAASAVRSPSWSLLASFGDIAVYRSIRRPSGPPAKAVP